ncbi:hypothetical protein RAS2_06210 [Phycisphaerae bacterium RAS2]|nr:hypothetical protein RAS2_06210 [Phycisphaerae bacterium RAS2]
MLRLVAHVLAPSPLTSAHVAEFVLWLAVGVLAGGVLAAMSTVVALLRELRDGLVRVERYQYELGQRTQRDAVNEAAKMDTVFGMQLDASADVRRDPMPDPPRDRPAAEIPWREIVQALHDIRDYTLLSDDQRREKKSRYDEEQWRQGREMMQSALAAHDFSAARRVAEDLARRFSNRAEATALPAEVETAREQFESSDVVTATKQVNDLINISAWQRARDVAQQLQQRHPDSNEARQLLLRIEREHNLAQGEQQRRMAAEVQRYVSRRRWEEALAAAKTFIERFPQSADAEALRLQLPTLEANAEIEVRQQLEAKIMDLARHGRYIQAADLARQVIAQFPGSPQAEALRSQLARLEDLANNPSAPPARIRLE